MVRFQKSRSSSGREKFSQRSLRFFSGKSAGGSKPLAGKAHGEGNMHGKKRVDATKVVADSCLRGNAPTEKDSFAFERRRSSSKEAGGTPIKMLLAEEMSKELELRRRTPSVIARLMGLDTLPTQQPVHKQQKKMSGGYVHRKSATGLRELCGSCEDHSFRKNNGHEQQEFKDVYEVTETSKVEKHNNRPVQKDVISSKISEAKMNLIRQKFMDTKRFSTDENLLQSKEFHEALEVLDSNKDLFVKFLQEPDSLFAKHLCDLQDDPVPPESNHVTVLKSSNAIAENGDVRRKLERKTDGQVQMQKDAILQKHGNGSINHDQQGFAASHKLAKSRFEVKLDACSIPTRIVVLKPSFRKAETMDRDVSSPSSFEGSHSVYRKPRDFCRSGNPELFPELQHRPTLASHVDIRHRPKAPREIAREITQKMRQSVGSESINVLTSGSRWHAAKKYPSYMSRKDSSPAPCEELAFTSRHFYDRKNRHSSSSHSSESSVSREAKKRLSERWKMTHRFQEVGLMGTSSSTLAEMLALSDRETRSMDLDSVISKDYPGESSLRNEALESERREFPLGISSRDGWKNEFPVTLSKSRSLPASSAVHVSPKTSSRRGVLIDSHFLPREVINHGRGSSFKEKYFNQKENTSDENSQFGTKKSQFLSSSVLEDSSIREIHVTPDDLKFEVRDQSEQRRVVSGLIGDTKQLTDQITVVECTDSKLSLGIHEEKLPEPTCITLKKEDKLSNAYNQKDLVMEEIAMDDPEVRSCCLGAEPESPRSSKGAEQPSPVSVLEPSFEAEVPSSDCFERVSEDLHGLRMQLQLLKLESIETSTDGLDIMGLSDEDTVEGCDVLVEDKEEASGMFRDKEARSLTFLQDMLSGSGFHSTDTNMLLETCYSSECLVDPGMFEKLDKKYGKQEEWPRSERKLLFDRINSGLAEILKPIMDPRLNLMGRRAPVVSTGEALVEEVWQLLARQSKEGVGISAEEVMMRDVGWLELCDDIETIGRDIEKLLMDGLMEEVAMGLSSGEM